MRAKGGWRGAARLPVILLLAALAPTNAHAHDFWLEPASALATRGDELVLHLNMGEHLVTEEERPLQKDRVLRFDFYGDRSGRRDLLKAGTEGQTPAARVRLEGGAALVVMDRNAQGITMEAAKFNAYLAEEGLDGVIAQRARLGQTDAPGRENYLRFLKVLVQEREPAAASANTLYKRRVGERLEMLLENDPGRLGPDGKLQVKVVFEGNPLAGAKVFACRRGADGQSPFVVSAVTTAKGLAEFKLDQPGLWLVRTVHMRAASGGPKAEPQWDSFWAAYTFAVRSAPVVTPAPAASISPK